MRDIGSVVDSQDRDWDEVIGEWRENLAQRGRPEVDPIFSRECRVRFLRDKVRGLENYLRLLRQGWRINRGIDERALLKLCAEETKQEIKKLQRSIRWTSNPIDEKKRDWSARVEKARGIPLWEFLNQKPNDRVLCPFHQGRKPALQLYPDGKGHCFACNTHTDTIGWVEKTEGLKFADAVRRLA